MPMFTVLYLADEQHPADVPKAYVCQATDYEDAEHQCTTANAGCDVVWIVETDNTHKAYLDYWGVD